MLRIKPSSFSSAATFPLSFPRYQSKNEGGRRLLVCRTQRKRFSFADNLKVILRSGVEPKKRGKGELNFIIMEAASCSLELCEELRRKEDATTRGMHGTWLLKFAFLSVHRWLRIVMQSSRYDHGCSSFN
ncbi:hypothetical protein V6Z11_A01G208000 [Gossypium hirsutum]